MASSSGTLNGNSSASPDTGSQSAAQRLLAKHSAPHTVEVEDVLDEEDIAHPPPSTAAAPSHDDNPASDKATMSDIAQGKQKVDDAAEKKSRGPVPAFNPNDEEAFPTLGGGKARTPVQWGKNANGAAAGINGGSNGTAPRAAKGPAVPAYQAAPSKVNIPGRHVESISLAPQQIAPRNQLKKPLPEIILDINKKSKAKIRSLNGPNGNIIFEGQGPVEAVRQALKEVVTQIGTKQSVKVPIPASIRPHIIGRQGANIQAIQKRTGAKIQIPKQDDAAAPADDDEDVIIDIVIEGDALGAEMARQEIQAIVDERTSTVNTRLKDIPAEYYPFLSSRIPEWENGRDVKIQIPHYHTWRDQAPPQPATRGQRVQFAPQPSLPIQLAGDRAAAQEIRQLIEKEAKRLSQSHTVEQTSIDRGRHQFIVGDRGFSAQDFLAETGCALIKPPSSDDSDELYIIGPANKIEAGVNKVMELASQMQTAHVDINKPHGSVRGGGLPHTANMARYFKQRQALEELERLHDASIVLPSDGSTSCEVYAKDFKNATKTRQELLGLVAAHPPSRFHPLPVDPFFHQQLKQREAAKVRRAHGVHIVFPDGHVESPELLLVYEGPGSPSEYAIPRSSPSDAEKREHEQALQEARKYLEGLLSQQPNIVQQELEAQPKYHDKIRKYVDREQKSLGQHQFPVQLLFGPSPSQRAPGAFSMRGPDSQVVDLNAKIQAFLEQEAKDEVERGFTTTFDYPQKFANFLIGKRGENINKLREEFDVDIQVQEGKVRLTGPEKKCAACRAHVLSQLKKFEDETTHTIKVKPQYHRDLIGAKGSQVNRLQDRYNVRVNFPRSAAPTEDDATEGGSVRNYRAQAPDEVIIKGPKKGADDAREELLNLLQWTMDNSHAGSVSVHQSQLPQLIGTQGREIEQLRLATGAQIDTPRGEVDKDGRVEIKLKGTKKQVDDAKRILLERAKVFDETINKTIEVERKFHKTLIGPMGSNVRKIVVDAGGPDDNRAIAGIVRFPKQGQEDNANAIRIQGGKVMVDKIVAAIEAQVRDRADQVTETLEVPTDKHRLLIGRGGEARRTIESKFNVSLDIPRQGATGPAATQIKITALPSDVEKARAHIEDLVKEQEGETVQVPRKYHNSISDNGQFFRKLRNEYKVTVDHGGVAPPPRSAAGGSKARGRANGATPLITDDPSTSAEAHSWELVDNTSAYGGTDGDDTIPWILRGSSSEAVAKAKAQVDGALKSASQPSWTGYLILPDSKAHRHIIGPGGSQINSIRKKTGTRVQVPRNAAEGEAVEIVGSKEGCEEAKDIILEIVRNGGNASGGAGRGRRE